MKMNEQICLILSLSLDYGSRITGGGFGGCTVSIVKDEAIDQFKANLTKAYEEKVGKTPEFYVVSIGDGPSRLA